jgi:Na+(H+)/acetate symporter ActP
MQISTDFVNGFIAAGGIAVIVFAVKAFLMARANRASIDMIYRLIDRVESDLENKIISETGALENQIESVEVNVLRDTRMFINNMSKKDKKQLLND